MTKQSINKCHSFRDPTPCFRIISWAWSRVFQIRWNATMSKYRLDTQNNPNNVYLRIRGSTFVVHFLGICYESFWRRRHINSQHNNFKNLPQKQLVEINDGPLPWQKETTSEDGYRSVPERACPKRLARAYHQTPWMLAEHSKKASGDWTNWEESMTISCKMRCFSQDSEYNKFENVKAIQWP